MYPYNIHIISIYPTDIVQYPYNIYIHIYVID